MAIQDVFNAVVEFNKDKVTEFVKAEIDRATDTYTILNDGLIAPLDEVGRRFSEGEFFVPEMLRASNAMKAGLELLRPLMEKSDIKYKGTIVIGTVKGDLHNIGKNLVIIMLEGAGFSVIDLGVDVDIGGFIAAAKENGADVVGLSALLTTTMPTMEATVAALKEKGLAIKTMVGGAPLTQAYADKIGADGYSKDAPGAVKLVRQFLGL
jgi:5-methyltetrahydrofolate--homocysteine methyltransferase